MKFDRLSSRRSVLAGIGAATFGTGVGTTAADAAPGRSIVVESEDGSRVDYRIEVSGGIETMESPAGDTAAGSTASGKVWWRDGYRFSGDVVGFEWDGPAIVSVDGERVDPAALGASTITFVGVEGSPTDYEFTVGGSVTAKRSGDRTAGSRAWGTVWNWKDAYEYDGGIESFSIDGPASVYVDGKVVDPTTVGDGDGGGSRPFHERVERAIHRRVNEIRTNRGLDPLDWHDGLARVADDYSRRMAERDFFSHTDPSGDGPGDRYEAAGLSCRGWGENILYNYSADRSAEAAARESVDQWMNSAGHRENVLRPWFRSEGIGVHVTDDGRLYATQNFGSDCS